MMLENELSQAQAMKVILGPGLSLWRGLVREEYLTALRPWSKAAKIYKEMSRDAIIGALLDAIKTPLLSSEFAIIPSSRDAKDVGAAHFLEDCIFGMKDMEWRQHVEETLDYLTFGFSISEKVLSKGADGRIYLHTLIPIGAETLEKWGDSDEYGNVKGFWQKDVVGKLLYAPMDKLLHFTFRSRKRNPQGSSLLEGLYRPWYFKKNLEVIEAIGAERDVGGSPVAELGEGSFDDTHISSLKEALEGFRMDETSYLIVPHGVKVTAYGGGGKVYNIRTMIRDWQHVIRQRFFADFIAQGSEQVGTQALAREATTFLSLILRGVQLAMLEVWNHQLVPYVFRYNTFDVRKLPIIDWKPPGTVNAQSLAQTIQSLMAAGVLTPGPEVEDHLRKVLGLPAIVQVGMGDGASEEDA